MEKLDFIDSKFRLAILAAKRGKQLVAGAKKKVDTHADNPLTIAVEEIFQGKIKFRILEENEKNLDKEDTSSLLLGNESEADEYDANVEKMLHKDDEDSEDYQSETF